MKRFYLIVALVILFCGAAFAQEAQMETSPIKKKVKDISWKTQHPRHEVKFGIGDHTMYINEMFDYFYDYEYYHQEEDYIDWFRSDVYIKSRIYMPVFSATYHYRLLKWLSIGGYISYTAAFTEKENIITGENSPCQDHFFAIAPSIQFTYLNRKYVTLYSGLALSMTWQISVEKGNRDPQSYLRGQITGIGITVGHKWFGFTELGYGNKGAVIAGFGYRFGSK